MRIRVLVPALAIVLACCAIAVGEEKADKRDKKDRADEPRKAAEELASSSGPAGFAWLSGEWHLKAGDVQCDEHWSDPRGGTQHGSFRLTKGKETRFLELFCIQWTQDGTILRLRHFSPEMKSWKGEEDRPRTWRLSKTDDRKAVFEAEESRVTYHRETDDVLVVRLDPIAAPGGKTPEGQVFRFTRVKR